MITLNALDSHTSKMNFPSVVLINFAFDDITLSMLIMIKQKKRMSILKLCIVLFVELNIDIKYLFNREL